MTVCRLSDGGLVLISPVPHTPALATAIAALGPVRAVISPNLLHHLYLGNWMEAYPEASSYAPTGLAAKRPDLTCTDALGPAFDQAFGTDLLRIPIAGMPKLNESLFFHRSSGTLIVTDFCFFLPEATGLTGLFATVTGVKTQARCEPSFRILIRDRTAFRTSLSPLRSLAIHHLSMCHHEVLSDGAPEALQGILDRLKVPATGPAES